MTVSDSPSRAGHRYREIRDEIAGRIARGELAHGATLPTRDELATQFQTARATVNRALQELAREGLIVAGSGRRTLVAGPAARTVGAITVVWNWPEDQERAGKDFLSDKPAMTTLQQLAEVRKVQAETRRIYSVMYSERHENRATVRAGELVQAGAIGKVIQTVGLGPHREIQNTPRPDWFYRKEQYGGILTDIASHQFDQFLFFTGSTEATIVASQVGNVNNPKYPGLEDFGDAMVRGNGGVGYVRVDWFTPDGLSTWGDGRLTVLGTDGYIEVRKNVDIGGRPGGSHLFLVDQKETRIIDCKDVALPYGERLVDDILNRTETSMPQAHVFLAMELALRAQAQAQRVG